MSDPFARRLGDDRGFMIIEVLVSALILVMASLAVFSALTNTDRVAGNQQKRSLAANFAQSELERIRSLPVEDIAAMRGTRTVTRDGIDYTISTTAKWVSDGDDEPQCTSRTGGVDYMRTTVSIAWEGMGQSKPVTLTSLFTPTAGAGGDTGSLSVHLINRNGGPVANVPITLDGPSTFTETTNKNGCVVFAFVPESLDYTVRFQRAGYVNEQSVQAVAETTTVTARETTKLQFLYDSGGYTKANFVTRASSSNTSLVKTYPPALQMYHNEQRSPGVTVRIPANENANHGTDAWDGAGVPWFPFTTPYSIYAGNCDKNTPPSSNFASKLVNISPLSMQNAGQVQIPSLEVQFNTDSQYSSRSGPAVGVKVEIDSGCGVRWVKKTDSNGNLDDPGVPYSTATRICAFIGGRKIVYTGTPIATTNPVNRITTTLYEDGGNYNSSRPAGSAQSCFD